MSTWDKRYASSEYIFGREPSHFLLERAHYFHVGEVALMVADGEGRNGVHLAKQGLRVHAVDGSSVALRKARRLAAEADVNIVLEYADVTDWDWYQDAYDHVIGIMIQFVGAEDRPALFQNMKSAVKPGGLLMLHGYRPEQLGVGTAGPSDPDYLYTEAQLSADFADWEILELGAEDRVDCSDDGSEIRSALINLVARKPIRD